MFPLVQITLFRFVFHLQLLYICCLVLFHKKLSFFVSPQLYEVEEGVDTQMLFLCVLVAAVSIAVLVGIWHWCSPKAGRRHVTQKLAKLDDADNAPVIENEYLALLRNPKVPKSGKNSC